MKNSTLTIISCIALAWLLTNSYFLYLKPKKIGYIETNRVLDDYVEAKKANEALQIKKASLQNQLDSLVTDWQSLLSEYEVNRSRLSKREIKEHESQLVLKQKQVNDFQKSIQIKIEEEDRIITKTIFNQINDYVQKYGKENNYQYILGANGSGSIVYADEMENVTDLIVQGLNNKK